MKPHTLHKKAQISPVFKYIFVLVVGAIILIFFLRFALKAEKSGEEVIKAEVLHALDASMQAFSVSEYSSGVIPSQPMHQMIHMKFGTKANCGKFTVIGQKYFVPIERVLFGPSEMKMKQLQAWTLAWSFPFKITNIFFIMNQRSKYYLIYEPGNEEFVRSISSYPPSAKAFEIEHIPKGFDIKYTNSETEPKSRLKVLDLAKVNYFNPITGVEPGLRGSYIKTSPSCEDREEPSYKCYGTVDFYKGSKKTGSSTFIGRPMMFGAITADTIEGYECQYGMALKELKRFIDLYKTKAEKLSSKKQCQDKYLQITNMLNNMKKDLNSLTARQSYENAAKLSSDANSIKEFNEKELAGDGNCEILF